MRQPAALSDEASSFQRVMVQRKDVGDSGAAFHKRYRGQVTVSIKPSIKAIDFSLGIATSGPVPVIRIRK